MTDCQILYQQDKYSDTGPYVILRRYSEDVILEYGVKDGKEYPYHNGLAVQQWLLEPRYERLSPSSLDWELIRVAIAKYDELAAPLPKETKIKIQPPAPDGDAKGCE